MVWLLGEFGAIRRQRDLVREARWVSSRSLTIKPRGGFFTRPELRAFATFAVWSDELQGAIGSPAYANQNYGWVFGVQAETWW